MQDRNIAGVVLAGGRSSRMKQDKALLDYNGQPLLDHMIALLQQTGVHDVYVSGDLNGYRCIPDTAPYLGPAHAIYDVLQQLDHYDGILFIPVDMPRLDPDILQHLLNQDSGGYFINYPLPVFITTSCPEKPEVSVKELLASMKVSSISLSPKFENCMVNTNTPEEWKRMLRA